MAHGFHNCADGMKHVFQGMRTELTLLCLVTEEPGILELSTERQVLTDSELELQRD